MVKPTCLDRIQEEDEYGQVDQGGFIGMSIGVDFRRWRGRMQSKAYKNGNAQNYIVELIPPSFG
jgi:hypothetical protein